LTSVLILRSNPIAPDPRVEKTARAIFQAGYRVSALGWDRTARLAPEEERPGFRVYRLPIRADFGNGLANLPNLLHWQVRLLIHLIRHRREYDVLHACDFDTILPALVSKALWGTKVIYDIYDFYADHLRRTPAWIKALIRSADLRAVRTADAVIIVDDARREQVAGGMPRHLEVIFNSPEDRVPPPSPAGSSSGPGSLRLAYIGLLQVERGLFDLLEVLERHPEWSLDLAGFGGDEALLLERARRLPNVAWHGRISYEKAMELSAAADALVALYDPSIPNHRYASPNKLFEAMMLSKPVVVARGTHMDEIVNAGRCGLIVEYGNGSSLEEALTTLASDPSLRVGLGCHGRQAYLESYSWDIMKSRLEKLYGAIHSV
jgi:glycosyltransferase involved in cell wall biosynthesis